MKKDFWVLLFLAILVFALWYKALFNFFAQDDFILINHFSQNNVWQDLKNLFGPPTVTHWRPIHNLYFFGSLMEEIRMAISNGSFLKLKKEWLER